MAAPNLELTFIFQRIADTVTAQIAVIKDEILTGRATGVPDDVTIQRLVEQKSNGIGQVNSVANRLTNQILGRVRQTYSATVTELAAGLAAPETLAFALPAEAGYTVTINDLGERVINLGEKGGTARIEAAAEREARFKKVTQGADLETPATVNAQNQRDKVRMVWVATFVRTCKDCLLLAGQTKTLGEWKQSGFMPGNGNTVCGEHCHCHLAPAELLAKRFKLADGEGSTAEEKLQTMMENGIKLQNRKIEELEELRGEKYAASTKLALLGQIKTERFNPNYTKKEALFLRKDTNKQNFNAFKKLQEEKYAS